MSDSRIITDIISLDLHRRRARAAKRDDAFFLHAQARDEIRVRVDEFGKQFSKVALVSGFPEFWNEEFGMAQTFPDRDFLGMPRSNFELLIHAISLHWSNDPVGQLIQCKLALRPNGILLCVLLGGATLQELRNSITEAEILATGGASPRIAPMGDIRDLGNLLQRAGLADAVADSVVVKATYPNALELMHDLRFMGETNALEKRNRVFAPKKLFLESARIYGERYANPKGGIRATFELIFLTARAPAASASNE